MMMGQSKVSVQEAKEVNAELREHMSNKARSSSDEEDSRSTSASAASEEVCSGSDRDASPRDLSTVASPFAPTQRILGLLSCARRSPPTVATNSVATAAPLPDDTSSAAQKLLAGSIVPEIRATVAALEAAKSTSKRNAPNRSGRTTSGTKVTLRKSPITPPAKTGLRLEELLTPPSAPLPPPGLEMQGEQKLAISIDPLPRQFMPPPGLSLPDGSVSFEKPLSADPAIAELQKAMKKAADAEDFDEAKRLKEVIAKSREAFSRATFRKELTSIFRDLGGNHSCTEAVQRVRAHKVPVDKQAAEYADILTRAVETVNGMTRRSSIAFAAGLAAGRPSAFDRSACKRGVGLFFLEVYPDLCEEVPRLPAIASAELVPTLRSVFAAEDLDSYLPEEMRAGMSKYRRELRDIVQDLAVNHNSVQAVNRVWTLQVPKSKQAAEFAYVLSKAVEIDQGMTRRSTLAFVIGLCAGRPSAFQRTECTVGLLIFFKDLYPNLVADIAQLPNIVKTELVPLLLSAYTPEQLAAFLPEDEPSAQ